MKELLVPRVKAIIDGLPFTSEGYVRAKNILKTKYGRPSEVANAHMQNIMGLPVIPGTNPARISEFYEKLVTNIQTLESMGKEKEIRGYVRPTLEKLPGIRADLVRLDEDWQEWGFPQLVEALRKWCERNPVPLDSHRGGNSGRPDKGGGRAFQAKQEDWKLKTCVYCKSSEHRSVDCEKIKGVADRRKYLCTNKLCYNCTGTKHRAAECLSKTNCQKCNGKHHTSICDKNSSQLMLATGEGLVVYPVVVVEVEGIRCRALLDTGAGSSYASASLIERLNKQPDHKQYKRIEMMMTTTSQKVEMYKVQISNIKGSFSLPTTLSKVDKGVLLTVPNPRYTEMISRHQYLKGVTMDDQDTKQELPVHVILGASEYAKLKTSSVPRVGKPGEPIAELTYFGWTIMSPGAETNLSSVYLTRSSSTDYEQLCCLDVLGLEDKPAGDQQAVYSEFQEQLVQHPEGWYETGLLWKAGHTPLPNNRNGSLRRLENLVKKLEKQPSHLDEYDRIIQDQLEQGIVERVNDEPQGERECYLPHKAVIRETAESTKMRIVFDASAKASPISPSLNDCLETGPPLQNLLWSVLVRNPFKPVALCADLKQAFLQVRIQEADRDALRFHWIKDKDPSQVEVLRFTRALFGLIQSPFLLGGTLKLHLESLKAEYPGEVEEIMKSLYVDDVISGTDTVDQARNLKEVSVTVFGEAGFELHKWHSNVPELEAEAVLRDEGQTYAKEQLGVKPNEAKLLGLPWNKKEDTLAVTFTRDSAETSKREMLKSLASVFDPLGVASPIQLVGKMIYREACEQHLPWDAELPEKLKKQWEKFKKSLPDEVRIPRSLATAKEPVQAIDLHVFGDTSGTGTAAAVYTVAYQESDTKQGLVAAKARLAKKGLTIPRLELVAAHMAANLVDNVRNALEGCAVRSVYGWTDSMVALHWIAGKGNYKQFVSNRVAQINAKDYIQWSHVSSGQNPADVGSRGNQFKELPELWLKGPEWLTKPEMWPAPVQTEPNKETEAEAKLVREIFSVAVEQEDSLEQILQKHGFWQTIRVTSWVARFIHNCKSSKANRQSGPLTTSETDKQVKGWVMRVQHSKLNTSQFQEDQLKLNLQRNEEGLYECRGRVQGCYPIYLPPDALLTEKMVHDAHVLSLHGGVGLTMTLIRQEYWVPRLRRLSKRVIRACYGCKKFQVSAFANPPTASLPTDRTVGSVPFEVLGVDFAGPIAYKLSPKKEGKAYILLFACSLTRAIHLELLPNQTAEEFIRSLKRFIARRGRPRKIYSDNGRSFTAAAKWLSMVKKSEQLQDHLAHQGITWQFNLSRAPWWGGQFERLVGLVKRSLYKGIGRASLFWKELEEVLLDVEVTLNNRPLCYVEDDIQLPVLTPSVMMFGRPKLIPDEHLDDEDPDMRKRARYLRRCKQVLWSRWSGEYLKSLRERHNVKHKTKDMAVQPGDVVLIQGPERNRGKWNIGIVTKLIKGRDGVVRAIRLRAGKSYLERAVQHLYPMELSCDHQREEQKEGGGVSTLNASAREFRPIRRAAIIAAENIRRLACEEAAGS